MQEYELNTARNCLRILISTYGIKEIFIPYYICPTIWQAIRAENCNIKFYHIDDNFFPDYNFNKNSYILYPNYFGICSKNVVKLAEKYTNLIVDNSHAAFMKHYGLASFCSYRKFFKTRDGAKLYINSKIQLPEDYYNYSNIPSNYKEFVQNELRLNKESPKFISKCTKKIMSCIDFEKEKSQRLEKFYEYDKKLKSTNNLNFNLSQEDIPFVYPYLSENKTQYKTFRYWNALPENFPEYKFYKYLKPIQLDNHSANYTNN